MYYFICVPFKSQVFSVIVPHLVKRAVKWQLARTNGFGSVYHSQSSSVPFAWETQRPPTPHPCEWLQEGFHGWNGISLCATKPSGWSFSSPVTFVRERACLMPQCFSLLWRICITKLERRSYTKNIVSHLFKSTGNGSCLCPPKPFSPSSECWNHRSIISSV